jgi:hypothetical protein
MACIMYRKDTVPKDQYCSLSFVPRIKRKTFCIVRKGEKQIQILDGRWMRTAIVAIMLVIYI